MIIELSLGMAAGFALGWLVHSAKRSTKALVLEELFSRKLKLAESDREQALRTSDEGKRVLAGLEERASAQDAEIERLLSELETSVAERLAAEVELARQADALAAASETLRVQLAAHEIEAEQLAMRARERGDEVDDLRGELTRRAAQLDELRAAQDAGEREAAESRATFESTRAELMRLQPLEATLADCQRVLATREVENAMLASHVAELEANAEHLRATEIALAEAREESTRQATTIARLERNLETATERMRALTAEQRLRTVEIKPPPKSPKHTALARDAAARDDLQRIAGIGPVLAKKLHRVGVNTFRQLAALSRDDVDRVAHALGLPAARIRRERWIAAARDELRAKTVGTR